jgi:hypothetical protein
MFRLMENIERSARLSPSDRLIQESLNYLHRVIVVWFNVLSQV